MTYEKRLRQGSALQNARMPKCQLANFGAARSPIGWLPRVNLRRDYEVIPTFFRCWRFAGEKLADERDVAHRRRFVGLHFAQRQDERLRLVQLNVGLQLPDVHDRLLDLVLLFLAVDIERYWPRRGARRQVRALDANVEAHAL